MLFEHLKKLRRQFARANTKLYPIFVVTFIGSLGFSIVIPFLVLLIVDLGGNSLVYALVSAAYPAAQLIGAPILGALSDRYGRKLTLALSQAGTLLAWVIFLAALYLPVTELVQVDSELLGQFSLTLPLVVIAFARIIDGLTGGNVAIAQAYVADVTTEETRDASYGVLTVFGNLGFIGGPALAGILASSVLGAKLPVGLALLISVVGLWVILRFMEADKPEELENPEKLDELEKQEESVNSEVDESNKLTNQGQILYLLAMYLIIFLGFNTFYAAFPVFAADVVGWNEGELGIYFTYLSLVLVIVQGPVLSYISKRVDQKPLILVGNLLLAVNFLLLITGVPVLLYLAATLFALGNGLMWPSVLSVLSKTSPKEQQGIVQGYSASISSFGSIFGLVFGGVLYTSLTGSVFIITAVCMVIVAVMSLGLWRFGS